MSVERAIPWVLRATWIAVLVAAVPALETFHRVARWCAGAGWLIGVGAMAIASVVSLTAARVIVPLSVPAAATAWIAGADTANAAAWLVAALLATALAFSPDIGRMFVQASAYGDERRFLLRAPVAYALACGVTWAVAAAGAIAGPVLLGEQRWVVGGVVTVFGVAVTVWGWPRWHKLSRRWFVLVPSGMVVHDHLVLAETLMVRRHEVASLHLALAGTEAADLTGPASGHAIELVVHEPVTVVLAATPTTPRGTVIHMRAGLICPTRPGQVLKAAAANRLPVG